MTKPGKRFFRLRLFGRIGDRKGGRKMNKNYCITHDSYENASCEFDIENLTPTYKLLIGIPGKSYAFSISKRLGLDTKILDRASSLIEKPATDIETLMKEIYDDRIAIEKIKEEHSKNLNQVELLRKSLEKEASSKLEKEEQKLEKVKNEARTILLNAKEEANEIINELTKLEKGNLKKANELRNSLNSKIKETSPNSGLDLSVLLKLNNQETIKPNKKSTMPCSIMVRNAVLPLRIICISKLERKRSFRL